MNQRLCDLIGLWIMTPTWYTTHPDDERRFYEGVSNISNNLGNKISYEEFHGALKQWATREPARLNNEFTEKKIKEYTTRAMDIFDFLEHTHR